MGQVANCPSCGTKIRADRDRCPKCRTWLVERDPQTAARQSQHFARWSAGFVAAFVLIVGGLWLLSDGEAPAAASTARPADPFAARRRPGPAAPGSETAPEPASDRPFLDPSGMGATAYAAGNYQSALEQYRAAVEKNPEDAESLSNLGQVLVRLGQPEEALQYFEGAIARIPNRWAYHFNLARALGILGRWDESVARYRHAQELFPDDYVTMFNLGLALHKKGDDAAAVPEYEKAIALAPEDASFRFALALSYERLRKNAEAAAAYQEYLRLAPDAADADRIRARMTQLTQ